MRTTLRLDDDVLAAARVLAQHRQSSIGDVISDLARQSLTKELADRSQSELSSRSGLLQLPLKASGGVADLELVNQLHDQDA